MFVLPEQTLMLSCNAFRHGILPCLKEFDTTMHKAMSFDDIRTARFWATDSFPKVVIWGPNVRI